MTKVLDGRSVASEIREEVSIQVSRIKSEHGVIPGLAAVLVGDDAASAVYVRNKSRACQQIGIHAETFHLPSGVSEDELLSLIDHLNSNHRFHGILVQMPLPANMPEDHIVSAINVAKDVDCMNPFNVGALARGKADFIPATPGGIQELLIRSGYDPSGKHMLICGRSNIVGIPLALLMAQKKRNANSTVTLCHTGTSDLRKLTITADILVAAMGRPKAIKGDMVKDGVIVVDVGINRVPDDTTPSGYRLVGDVDYEEVFNKAEAITPVPGGVGPMTVAMLLVNTLKAVELSLLT